MLKKEESEFINKKPNKIFIETFDELNNILNSKDNNDNKVKRLKCFILNLNQTYKEVDTIILFPTYIASLEFAYNKLFYNFSIYLCQFLKEMTIKSPVFSTLKLNEKNYEDNNSTKNYLEKKVKRENFSFIKKPKEKKISKKVKKIKEYDEFKTAQKFLENFENLILFLKIFSPIFKKVSENRDDKKNITRLIIFLLYFNYFKKKKLFLKKKN